MGQRLSEARRRRNLTLADIARTTKIPVHLLEAIDRDDLDHMPSGFVARAFVRAYANEVGVNPRELVDDIEENVGAKPEADSPPSPAQVDRSVPTRSVLFTILVALACVLYYVGLVPTQTPPAAPQVAAEIPMPAADPVEPVAAPVPEAVSDVELQIQSSGGCIVSVTADGRAIPSQEMPPGQRVVFKARGEVVLRVGDSGACAPATTPESASKPPRRAQHDTAPNSPAAVSHAVDQQSDVAVPVVEPVEGASDAVLPPSDRLAPPTATDQF